MDSKLGGVLLGAGAAAAALMASGKLRAAEGVTPEDIINTLGQAESTKLEEAINRLTAAIAGMQDGGGSSDAPLSLGNPQSFTGFRVLCAVANQPYQLPDRKVPYKMTLVIKALPTNGGIIYVAPTQPDSVNINSSYPLIANEAVELEVQNADDVYISATAAGEGVACIVEQRNGGG